MLSWPKIPIIFFLVKNWCSFFIFLFPLDVEVIVYKSGSVTDVRNGELCKVDLDVFDGSMPPGETVVKCSGSFLILMLFRSPFPVSCYVDESYFVE